jgi:TPR repeat protein
LTVLLFCGLKDVIYSLLQQIARARRVCSLTDGTNTTLMKYFDVKHAFLALLASTALWCCAAFAQTLPLEQARGLLAQRQYAQAETLLRQQTEGPVRDTMLGQAIIGVREDAPPLTIQRVNEALTLLQKAYNASHPEAIYPLAVVYGLIGRVSDAQNLLSARATQNDGRALYLLGRMADLSGDYRRAVQLYERSSFTGNADALNGMGYLYANGLGVQVDDQRAANYYLQAIIAGSIEAGVNLVLLSDARRAQLSADSRRVLLERAAQVGDGQARQMLSRSAPVAPVTSPATAQAAPRSTTPPITPTTPSAPAPVAAAPAPQQPVRPVAPTPPVASTAPPAVTPTPPAAPVVAAPPAPASTPASTPIAAAPVPPPPALVPQLAPTPAPIAVATPAPAPAPIPAPAPAPVAKAAPAPEPVPPRVAAPAPEVPLDTAQAKQVYAQAMRLRRGENVTRDLAQSLALLERAAGASLMEAQLALADTYEYGLGVPANPAKAKSLRETVARARPDLLPATPAPAAAPTPASAPTPPAPVAIAAPAVTPAPEPTPSAPPKPSMSLAQATQTYEQAMRLRRGEGVMRDFERAAALLQQAADAGLPQAQRALAEAYEYGLGVPADNAKAQALRRAAANVR